MSCICQECGKEYRIDLMLEDWVREEINTKTLDNLCSWCIITKLEKLMNSIDAFSYYYLTQ